MDEILTKVSQMIAELIETDADAINPGSRLVEDLGLDSLDAVALVMMAEDEFGIEIDEDAVESLNTVSDIAAYLQAILPTNN